MAAFVTQGYWILTKAQLDYEYDLAPFKKKESTNETKIRMFVRRLYAFTFFKEGKIKPTSPDQFTGFNKRIKVVCTDGSTEKIILPTLGLLQTFEDDPAKVDKVDYWDKGLADDWFISYKNIFDKEDQTWQTHVMLLGGWDVFQRVAIPHADDGDIVKS